MVPFMEAVLVINEVAPIINIFSSVDVDDVEMSDF
jgi:hypothetical protein